MASSVHLLQARLKEVSASLNEIRPLIDRLRNFTHAVGQGDEARLELGSEIHSRLKVVEEESELLNVEVEVLESAGSSRKKTSDSSEKEAEKRRVIGLVGKLASDLKKYIAIQSPCFFRSHYYPAVADFLYWDTTG